MANSGQSGPSKRPEPLRLHIGGEEVREGWKIVNIQKRDGVDFVGSASDLSAFADGTVTEVYGSHVYEHLDYKNELLAALREAHRVLKTGGLFRAGVPDLESLAHLILSPALNIDQKFEVQKMIYGGHIDDFDYHYAGFTFDIFHVFLRDAGFTNVRRVPSFGLFKDTSEYTFAGVPISLNVVAMKPLRG